MDIRERLLLFLSHRPEEQDFSLGVDATTTEEALDLLRRVYPNFGEIVSGKRVVDFGCGRGKQCIALVREYGCSVVGVDSNKRLLQKAIRNASEYNIPPERLTFLERAPETLLHSFDIAISQNSFEHFAEPARVLGEMRDLLNASGLLLLTFGPPWLAPYGSHMHFFCKVPWINILFPERVVMSVRRRFRNDGASRYAEIESGLNKMTVAKFERIVSSSNLDIRYRNYLCIRGISLLQHLPLLRELFIIRVSAILSKSE